MDLLQRFVDAQDSEYRIAYAEMKSGKKKSHWIWYVFPQLSGLGSSEMSKRYGLTVDEAILFLDHPILSLRLRNILKILLEHKDKDIVRIMGELDALKLQASMTLFNEFSPDDIFDEVLNVFYGGQKHQKTLNLIYHVQE